MHWLSAASAWYLISCLFIIALYILKKRYEPKQISSHLLWRRALQEQEANKPWQRLKQRLLLWLQLLVAIVIVLALMEPVIEKQLTEDSHVVMLLDRSSSMVTSSIANGESYFQRAQQEMLEWLEEEYDGGAVTLVTNGDYPTIVLNRVTRKNEIEQAIRNIAPYYGASDDETALSLARALADEDEQVLLHYYVDERFKVSEPMLQSAEKMKENWHVYGGAAEQVDYSIRSFTLSSIGDSVSAFVTVLHEADSTLSPLQIEVTAYNENSKVIYQDTVKKNAEQGGMTTFQLDGLPAAHYYFAQILTDEHDLNRYNNGQFGLINEQSSFEALLISEGNLFLEKALQLMNVGITKINAASNVPANDTLSKVQFIIVDGNYEALLKQPDWAELLQGFPLWVIDHPADHEMASLINKAPVVNEHPVTQYFTMEDTYISAVKNLNQAERNQLEVLVEYGGAPVMLAGMNGQKPFLRFAFALQASDLPLRATFPILMMQSIEYMTSGSEGQIGTILVSTEPTIALLAATSSSQWRQVAADDTIDGVAAKAINNEPNQPIIAPSIPGVYELVEQNEQGELLQKRTAIVSGDNTEFISGKITAAIQSNDSGGVNQADTVDGKSGWSSIIPWLAVLLLLLAFTEWEVYRRGL